MTEGLGLWGWGAACALGTGRTWCFGRNYTQSEFRGVCVSDKLAAEGWGRAPNTLSSSVSSSGFCPDASWGPQSECRRNITSRHGCWLVQVTSLSSHTDLLCSNQFAFDFGPISRPCLQLIPWLLTPDWVIIEALLWWTQAHSTAPSGMGLRLCYDSSSSSHSPVRIRSMLKKEAVFGRRVGAWQLSVSEWRTRL